MQGNWGDKVAPPPTLDAIIGEIPEYIGSSSQQMKSSYDLFTETPDSLLDDFTFFPTKKMRKQFKVVYELYELKLETDKYFTDPLPDGSLIFTWTHLLQIVKNLEIMSLSFLASGQFNERNDENRQILLDLPDQNQILLN